MAEKHDETPKMQRVETTPVSAARAISPMLRPTPTPKINTMEIKSISMESPNQQRNSLKGADPKKRNSQATTCKIPNSLSSSLRFSRYANNSREPSRKSCSKETKNETMKCISKPSNNSVSSTSTISKTSVSAKEKTIFWMPSSKISEHRWPQGWDSQLVCWFGTKTASRMNSNNWIGWVCCGMERQK